MREEALDRDFPVRDALERLIAGLGPFLILTVTFLLACDEQKRGNYIEHDRAQSALDMSLAHAG